MTDQTPARATLAGEAMTPIAWTEDRIAGYIQGKSISTPRIDIYHKTEWVKDVVAMELASEVLEAWLADHAAAAVREAELKRSLSIADALYSGSVDTIAELERINKGLLELNERNCNEALRIKNSGDAAMLLAIAANDLLTAKNVRIQQLEAELAETKEKLAGHVWAYHGPFEEGGDE